MDRKKRLIMAEQVDQGEEGGQRPPPGQEFELQLQHTYQKSCRVQHLTTETPRLRSLKLVTDPYIKRKLSEQYVSQVSLVVRHYRTRGLCVPCVPEATVLQYTDRSHGKLELAFPATVNALPFTRTDAWVRYAT